ncbi:MULTISPECIES: DNA translocase FtsK [unclassified Variovorax]|uniref:DNA translocase FtsK n=1 Tax=unclassified Variovorax TaxID=663243 RepID=UPI001BD3BE25|nr:MULTISPECIES: DNA translocase FtsK [unclassified Variovorax]
MTYSLNTLHSSSAADSQPVRLRAMRFAQEISLIAGFAVLLFWLLSMFSYTSSDAAWSTSGTGGDIKNWGGRFGAWLADGSYFLAGFTIWWCFAAGVRVWLSSLASWLRGGEAGAPDAPPPGRFNRSRIAFWVGLVLLLAASAVLEWSRLYSQEFRLPGGHGGGVLGTVLGPFFVKWVGFTGSALIAIAVLVIGTALVFRFSWSQLAERIGARVYSLFESRREKREIAEDIALGKKAVRERRELTSDERALQPDGVEAPDEELRIEPRPKRRAASPPVKIEPAVADVPKSDRVAKERQKPLFRELPDSKLPQVDLLDAALVRQETVSADTLEMTSRMIEKKLKDFGVEVRVVLASPGPVITRYEIEPATGVKGSQIVGLAKDLARSLSLISIRVVETIPGKNYMALELPNAKRQSIKLSEILGSQIYNDGKSFLTMGLGKDIIGNPVVADLAKMPHVLVAGTTGSGKSVGINAMILSLLYKAEARDVRLLMIDPKMLEMSVYEGIPHLLAPVVTDMRQAAHGLNWCVAEMERRYKLMSKLGVRNLAGYNTKIDEAKAREEFVYNPFSLTPESPEPLQREPHIVVVIDELADLMMVVGKKIEELIARLAQKARAAGIHLILATQRPSVDVITGLIKANIPTRIAFQVSSKIDSRTILDQMGAEALLGMGDMLYMPSGTGLPIRVHGAFVSDEEVHRVVAYLKSQGEPDYIDGVLEGGTVDGEDGFMGEGGGDAEKDPMYDQAVEVVLKNRKASISLVQRHLKIGYNRAARLVEDMEKAGLVSAMSGAGQREILVPARAE